LELDVKTSDELFPSLISIANGWGKSQFEKLLPPDRLVSPPIGQRHGVSESANGKWRTMDRMEIEAWRAQGISKQLSPSTLNGLDYLFLGE
jgi:hypothetical protein